MKYPSLRIAVVVLFLTAFVLTIYAAPLERVPATTLKMPALPPAYSYSSANALGNLAFLNPIAIVTPPGETNRLFIAEKNGTISVITNLAVPTKTFFLNISNRVISTVSNSGGDGEQGLLGLAFHPGFATNGYFYVFYTGNDTTSAGNNNRHDILSRFTTNAANPNLGDPNSEVKLIRQRDEASNHNGGDLHFGPDGYLYVSLGDEGDGNDTRNNSQTITKDFFAGLLRIDVDKRPGSLNPNPHASVTAPTNYAVPPDNPFVHTNLGGPWNGRLFTTNVANLDQVRTEFWAIGLRNPWRFSFDRETGRIYLGDVGQGTREEIDIIVKGGNYGWAVREGTFAGPKAAPTTGFTHINPILDYDNNTEGVAVTGGVVYRGSKITELYGAYIFADYGGSGRIWSSRYNGTNATPRQILLEDTGISAFGTDPSNADVLYADVNAGMIRRFLRNSNPTNYALPATLAATGVFTNLATLEPNPGVVPYEINLPFWSDYAHKQRWFTVTNLNRTIGFNADGNWSFPTSSIWIKHFELELTNGVPESRKRLETRFIVRTTVGIYGATYRWGDSLTNATLVPDEGTNETFVVYANGGGILRTQVWHYPSRTECLSCHTAEGGFALGFNTAQLNRDFDYGGTVTNQLAALSHAGYFSANVSNIHTLRTLVHPTNELASLEARARSYLNANCVQCHQPAGTSQALWDARIATKTAGAKLVNGALINNLGDTNNRVIVPGSLSNSVLLTRISTRGPGQMPPLATSLVDTQGVALIAAWITNDLPSFLSFTDWQLAQFGSTNSPEAGPLADPDGDGANNRLESLTGTNPTNALDAWKISIALSNDVPVVEFPQIANRGFEVQSAAGLFGSLWTPLNVPANAPFFSASNRNASVTDSTTPGDSRYYRVRVFEP